ncbi:hypothetical protein [Desulfosporosinus sp. I2]|uniref:hypothetical protein n=1 Tax=Desulfosporosinus sp. I2 TaxID=1617025 RepID=UPI000696A741|nr:hypothetical protein [Desulfosporosinus sp. I2]
MMSVSILVDALHLLSPKTGIGKYTYENCIQLQNLASDEIHWYYNYGYISDKLIDVDCADKRHNGVRRLKSLLTKYSLVKRSARLIMNIGQQFSKKSYDLYWQPNFIPSKGVRAKKLLSPFMIFHSWYIPIGTPPKGKNI